MKVLPEEYNDGCGEGYGYNHGDNDGVGDGYGYGYGEKDGSGYGHAYRYEYGYMYGDGLKAYPYNLIVKTIEDKTTETKMKDKVIFYLTLAMCIGICVAWVYWLFGH